MRAAAASAIRSGDPGAPLRPALRHTLESGLGVDLDDEKAVHWYTVAAEQVYPTAQLALGIKLRHGFGVPRDDVAALMWYRIAADCMEPGAEYVELIRNLEFTKGRMSAAQIGEAYRRAALWWETHEGRKRGQKAEEDDD